MSKVFDVLSRFRLSKGFPVVAKAQPRTKEVTLLGPPKNGAVAMILQLPCTSVLLSV